MGMAAATEVIARDRGSQIFATGTSLAPADKRRRDTPDASDGLLVVRAQIRHGDHLVPAFFRLRLMRASGKSRYCIKFWPSMAEYFDAIDGRRRPLTHHP
uniref:Uncharacterized protein n=1 Tax=Paraburkholderia sprentiae WSM5005 TaxID=754502 RepID=A0A1I9YI84_9BURK